MKRALTAMIAQWEHIATHASTYNLTLDDWLNDLDLRDLIERELAKAPAVDRDALRSRLELVDQAFRDATRESNGSLWGPRSGAEHHATRQWWYFRYPSSPGDSMRADLEAAGILSRKKH